MQPVEVKAKVAPPESKVETANPVNAAATATVDRMPTVLSVDDSAIIQVSIKRALQENYNVLLAGKAEEALDILKEVQVELMLLDLTMADVDGLEFCKTVRAIPEFKDLPDCDGNCQRWLSKQDERTHCGN